MASCCASCARGGACESGRGSCGIRTQATPQRRSGGLPAPLGASRRWLATVASPRALAVAHRTSGGIRDLRDEADAAGYTPNNAELTALNITREQWQNAPARQRLAWSRGETSDDDPSAGETIGHVAEEGLDTLRDYLRGEQQTQIEQYRQQGNRDVANINAAAQVEAERLRLEAERVRAETARQLAAMGHGQPPVPQVQAHYEPPVPQVQAHHEPPVPQVQAHYEPPAPPKEDKPTGWTDGEKIAAGAAVAVGVGLLAYAISQAMRPKPPPPALPQGYDPRRGY